MKTTSASIKRRPCVLQEKPSFLQEQPCILQRKTLCFARETFFSPRKSPCFPRETLLLPRKTLFFPWENPVFFKRYPASTNKNLKTAAYKKQPIDALNLFKLKNSRQRFFAILHRIKAKIIKQFELLLIEISSRELRYALPDTTSPK